MSIPFPRHPRRGVVIGLALLSFVSWTSVYAQQHNAPALSTATVITSTVPNQLVIGGVNFGAAMPAVALDGLTLNVNSYSDTVVVAYLPAGLIPGTYRVSLVNNSLQGN